MKIKYSNPASGIILPYLKTGITWMLCLLSFTTMQTSCSSDDEQESTEQPTDGPKLRQLTITEVPITRAELTDDGTSLSATWKKDDQATYFNLSTFTSSNIDYGPLTASSSAATSSFTGTVSCEENHKIALFYPATDPIISGTERGKFSITLSGQKGTLEDIATRYHYIYGVGEVTSVTETTASATISSMKSLLSMCKFTFKDEVTNDPIPVKTLQIGYGNNASIGYPQAATLYPFKKEGSVTSIVSMEDIKVNTDSPSGTLLTVSLESETSDGVYVMLLPCGNVDADDFFFSVTGSNGTYTGTAQAKLNAGKYYPVTLKLTK